MKFKNLPSRYAVYGVVVAAVGCSAPPVEPNPTDTNVIPELVGPFLGQTPPGSTPERFGPAELHANQDWFWHGGPSFTRDGLEMFFVKYDRTADQMQVWSLSTTNEAWNSPQRAPFCNDLEANQPTFLASEDVLQFVTDDSLFRVARVAGGWSSRSQVSISLPEPLSLGWDFSLTADGTMYLVLWNEGQPGIYRSSLENGAYNAPVSLGPQVNTTFSALGPVVASDESYLIFASNRPGGFGMHDLWISFHQVDGTWSTPINMGREINSANEDGGPTMSPDGRYLFYTTERSGDRGYNPYWVSASIIDSIQSSAGF